VWLCPFGSFSIVSAAPQWEITKCLNLPLVSFATLFAAPFSAHYLKTGAHPVLWIIAVVACPLVSNPVQPTPRGLAPPLSTRSTFLTSPPFIVLGLFSVSPSARFRTRSTTTFGRRNSYCQLSPVMPAGSCISFRRQGGADFPPFLALSLTPVPALHLFDVAKRA